MPFIRIWVHLIWSTKNREQLLPKETRSQVFEHIRQNAREKGIFLDTIGGYVDHVHALISLGAEQSIAKVAQLLKGESSYWFNKSGLAKFRLEWQEEYFALLSPNQVLTLCGTIFETSKSIIGRRPLLRSMRS